jgi:hypothetical protein
MKRIGIMALMGLLLIANTFGTSLNLTEEVQNEETLEEEVEIINLSISQKLDEDIAEIDFEQEIIEITEPQEKECKPETVVKETVKIKKVPVVTKEIVEVETLVERYPEAEYVGVTIDGQYYTFGFMNDTLVKVELDGAEAVYEKIVLEKEDITNFIQNYDKWNWIEKFDYLINQMGVSTDFLFRVVKLW